MLYEFRWKKTDIRIDSSWIYNLFLIIYILSKGVFPFYYKNINVLTYTWMGIVGATGLLTIVLLHEMSHILMGIIVGKPAKSVTLFLTGGVREYRTQIISVSEEFIINLAGPFLNIVFYMIFNSCLVKGEEALWSIEFLALIEYFRTLNVVLIFSNLIPVLPFDSGRIVSALLCKVKNHELAINIMSFAGMVLALLVISIGILILFNGIITGGICWILIGISIRKGAKFSKKRYIIRKILKGEKIQTIMSSVLVSVPLWISLEKFFENYLCRYQFKLFPVMGFENEIIGCIRTENLRVVSPDQVKSNSIKEYISPVSENAVDAENDILNLLSIMEEKHRSRFIVQKSKRVAGIVTHKDVLKFLEQKLI